MHEGVGEAALLVQGLAVHYGRIEALDDVALEVDPGEVVALVGPNGAGKSTLLRAVLGLVPYEGTIVVHERRRSSVAYVPQRRDIELDFPLTVAELVATGRRALRRTPWAAVGDRQAVARCLSRVGLDGLDARSLGSLSGGELQRALLARALAQEPSVLLLDETLAGVDASAIDAIVDLLHLLAHEGAAIVLATHELALVRERFARCIAVNRTVIGDGDPTEILCPEALARFFERQAVRT